MVRFMRSARIKGGKFMEAIAFGKEMAEFSQKKYNAPPVSVFLDSFGNSGTIRWMVDYDDLATLEKVQSQVLTDPEYFELITKAMAADIFLDGTVEDVVTRQM